MTIKIKNGMQDNLIMVIRNIEKYSNEPFNIDEMMLYTIIIGCFEYDIDIDYSLKHMIIRRSIKSYLNNIELLNLLKEKNFSESIKRFNIIVEENFKILMENKMYFTFIFFINSDYTLFKSNNQFSILENVIRVVKWNEISEFDFTNGWDQLRLSQDKNINPLFTFKIEENKYKYRINTKFTPILINIESYHMYQALREAENIFLLWRLSLNLKKSLNTLVKLKLSGQPKLPLSNFMVSPAIFIFNKEKKFLGIAKNDMYVQYDFLGNKDLDFDSMSNISSIINHKSIKSDINTFIKEILIMYQDALDELTPSGLFMRLWQVLERICLDDPSRESTLRRLFILLQVDQNDISRPLMKVLTNIRNEFVHSGQFNSDSDLLFSLKDIIDNAIIALIDLRDIISDEQELRIYYEFHSRNNTVIEQYLKVIDKIKESRK